jgi:pimeloyl-ACP methyl ester carboxylesterase
LEAFAQGSRGLAWELHALARPWGFRPEEIRVPVSLWYGERDRLCPLPIGRDLAARIPGARLTVVDDRHQLLFTRWRDLLAELSGRVDASAGEKLASDAEYEPLS